MRGIFHIDSHTIDAQIAALVEQPFTLLSQDQQSQLSNNSIATAPIVG